MTAERQSMPQGHSQEPKRAVRVADPKDPYRRVGAWAPTAKAAALFLLPLPLTVALIGSLIAGDAERAAFASGSLACLWLAAVLIVRALVAEARYFLGERSDPPKMPLKLFSAALTVAGVSFAALAAGHTLPAMAVFAALAGIGHFAFYGRDLRPKRITVADIDGIDRAAVILQLKQAYGRLRGIEAAAQSIAIPDFRDRPFDPRRDRARSHRRGACAAFPECVSRRSRARDVRLCAHPAP